MTSVEERLRAEIVRLNQYNQRLIDALAQARAEPTDTASPQGHPKGQFATLVDALGDGTMAVAVNGRMLRVAQAASGTGEPPGRGETVLLDLDFSVEGGLGRAATGKVVTLVALLLDGRALVTNGGGRSVLRLADALSGTRLRPGDQLLVDEDARFALERVAGSPVERLLETMPELDSKGIGGLGPQLRALRDAVAAATPGILLHGPTGCGKTMLAQVIATDVGGHRLQLRVPELMSKYVGDIEERLSLLAARVIGLADDGLPVVLHLTDLDGLVRIRTEPTSLTGRFTAVLDRVAAHRDITVIAETNRVDLVDPAVLRPDRFPVRLHIGPPDRSAAEEIVARLLRPGEVVPMPVLDLLDDPCAATGAALAAAVGQARARRVRLSGGGKR